MLNLKKKTLWLAASAFAVTAPFASANAADFVAKVNGVEIKKSELDAIEKALPEEVKKREPDEKKRREALVKDLINLYVLKDAAKKAGLDKDPQIQEAVARATEQVLIQAFLAKQLQDKLTEKALKDKYDEFAAKFPKDKNEVHIFHILVQSEAEAKTLINKLQSGGDFQALAREFSKDQDSSKDGGDLGYVIEDAVPDFEKPLKELKPGQYTKEAVKSNAGYHIFLKTDQRKAKPPKFDEMKPLLARLVEQAALQELVQKLRDKATIEMPDGSKPEAKAAQAG